MKNKLWLIILLIIFILGVVCIIMFLPKKSNKSGLEKAEIVLTDFGKGLKDLEIEYEESSVDISGYDVLTAKMYIVNESRAAIYYIGNDNENYEKIKKDGHIVNKNNSELIISGIVENGYLFYLEQNFPKGNEVYELFNKLISEK